MTNPVAWIEGFRRSPSMVVHQIDLSQCEPWVLNGGVVMRPDSRFFRVVGVDTGNRVQLFLDQPEVGLLGFILADVDGTRRVLIQAKDEPGNKLLTQIAPTVQATKSNSDGAHGGLAVPYLDLFIKPTHEQRVLNDSQSSEHGERFWKKQNRNKAILVSEPPPVANSRYEWFDLSEVLTLMDVDFLINTDSRSVLAATPWGELCDPGRAPFDGESEFHQLLSASFQQDDDSLAMDSLITDVHAARNQVREPPRFAPISAERLRDSYTREWVRYIQVSSESREVGEWAQPIYETGGEEKLTLIVARRHGRLVVLIRLSEERGLRTHVELTTTISNERVPPVIERLLLTGVVKATLRQTEEGSRFYHSHAQFDLVDCDAEVDDGELRNYGLYAVGLATFNQLAGTSAMTTNELRTAASLILRWL